MSSLKLIKDCRIGEGTKVYDFVNLYGCEIGTDCMIGPFVEVQKDVKIGNRCRVQTHTFICSLVTIEDDVFVGHGVMFINDREPPSGDKTKWEGTLVKKGASIGSNSTIMPVTIGERALIGAGSVVTKDVPADSVVAGNPAKEIRKR